MCFSVERNPFSSGLWRQPCIMRVMKKAGKVIDLDYCMFQAHYKKPTRIYTNIPGAESLGRRCAGGHVHDYLQGTVRTASGSRWRTSLASAYPPALCRELAALVRHAVQASSRTSSGRWHPRSKARIEAYQKRWHGRLCSAAGCDSEPAVTLASLPPNGTRAWPRDAQGWGGGSRFAPAHSRGR